MKITILACCAVAALHAIAPGAMFAHHGAGAYNLRKSTTLMGIVTSFDWINPHCLLHFDVQNGAGEVQHWTIELYHPFLLARAGWKQDSLKPGDPITITFHAAKNGAPNGYFRDSDGKLSSKDKEFSFHLPGDDRIK
jgi:hypothetical protein